jgi:hypothetical protein
LLTVEHVISEALGGKLTSRLLCNVCNSRLGHQLEGKAKADPTVRLLAKGLRTDIPKLAEYLEEGQRYITTGSGPSSIGLIKQGRFRVKGAKLDDGSLMQETLLAEKTIRKMLEQKELSDHDVEDALRRFRESPDDTRIEISQGIEVVKWSVSGLELALDGPMLNPLIPTKSAYEFLALHVGDAIYAETPPLKAIRRALYDGVLDEQNIEVERLHAPEAKPFHGLVFEGNKPYAKVQVRLFGKLAFRIHFKCLSVAGPRGMYTHDLATNRESVEQLPPADE